MKTPISDNQRQWALRRSFPLQTWETVKSDVNHKDLQGVRAKSWGETGASHPPCSSQVRWWWALFSTPVILILSWDANRVETHLLFPPWKQPLVRSRPYRKSSLCTLLIWRRRGARSWRRLLWKGDRLIWNYICICRYVLMCDISHLLIQCNSQKMPTVFSP